MIDYKNLLKKSVADKIQQNVVGAIILQKDVANNELCLLVLDRIPNDFMGGIEEFPSGKVEEGESLFAALKREVFEESGLIISKPSRHAFYFDYISGSGKKSRQFNFVVEGNFRNVTVNPAEHLGYRWLPIKDIRNSRITENVVRLLENNI